MTQISLLRTAGRAGLAATAAAFLAFGLAAPASAEPELYEGAVTGTYVGNAESGTRVKMDGGAASTSLFNLKLQDGTILTTYCIDFSTSIVSGAGYAEDKWENYPGKGDFAEPAKVHWILQNAYPNVTAEELGAAAGVEGLTPKDALGGTQAAIWHFSNGMDLTDDNSAGVKAVYEYLVGNAEDLPQTSEPDATLSITPGTAEGVAGTTVGEFTIETNATSAIEVDLSAPAGVELVDLETGEAVTEVENGDKVGFEVPAGTEAGQASFSLETSAHVATGRLFQGIEIVTQTLITAEGGETTASASASATWTAGGGEEPTPSPSPSEEPSESPAPTPVPTPTPSESPSTPASPKPSAPDDDRPALPVTGGALAGLVAAGIAALGAGGGAIYLSRKRKAAGTSTED
ncbi:thioester domain-containing protein [Nocardiopsis sp. NPDC006139]|uniref:thioester domain-containing protein n=1 Tax=unclassified Nocardiopsis TaxID=2649073 RepID=UPI0033AF8485